MEFDDNASEASVGSVISLQSLEDSSPIQEKSRSKRRSRKDHSPYTSRQNGDSTRMGRSLGKTSGHNAWATAIRNGFTGLSTENMTGSNRWAHAVRNSNKKVSSADRKSGPFSRDEHILSSGKPAYKSQEDYYDEIMELRQVVKQLKEDNSALKTKLQRVTQENVLKDRQIKDFLNPNKQPEEIRRTLTDRKADSSAVVASLKQKLHLMERNVKDKESELRKLKSDLKSTNLEEMRIQSETYFQETQRLQSVLSSVYSQAPGTRNVPQSRIPSSSRQSSRTSTPRGGFHDINQDKLEQILDANRSLEAENRGLKKDLFSALERPQKGNKTTKEKNVDYADMNRVQMLRKITELDQALEEAEEKVKNRAGKIAHRDEKETERGQKDETESELRKQRETIASLKEDRAHYREEADRLRSELRDANKELEQLRDEKANDRSFAGQQATNTPRKPVPKQRTRAGSVKKGSSLKMDKEKLVGDKTEDRAARTLQRNWKRYKGQKVGKEDDDLSAASTGIQAILRGHAVRKRRINELGAEPDEEPGEEDIGYDEAVTRIQSVLRAHHARRRYSKNMDKFEKRNRVNSKSDHSDRSDDDRLRTSLDNRASKSRVNLPEKRSNSSFLNKLKTKRDTDVEDEDEDIVFGSKPNLREPPKPSPRKLTSHAHVTRPSLRGSSDNSDDDIQTSSRSQKRYTTPPKAKERQSGFKFGQKSDVRQPEQKESVFFGRGDDEVASREEKNASSALENLFSPTRPMRQPFDREEGEEKLGTSKKQVDKPNDNKEKKSIFSWGSIKSKKPKETNPTKADNKNEPSSKSASVWTSRASEHVDDDDDDDDDVVVTPKISRRTPTKTASLLDELF